MSIRLTILSNSLNGAIPHGRPQTAYIEQMFKRLDLYKDLQMMLVCVSITLCVSCSICRPLQLRKTKQSAHVFANLLNYSNEWTSQIPLT